MKLLLPNPYTFYFMVMGVVFFKFQKRNMEAYKTYNSCCITLILLSGNESKWLSVCKACAREFERDNFRLSRHLNI